MAIKYKYAFLYPIVLSLLISYTILIMDGGISFMDGIVIAIIGVIGALVGVIITGFLSYFQLKRDGKSIDKIGNETARMDPKVEIIEENTKKSKEVLMETIKPDMLNMKKQQEGLANQINYVVKEFEYQERLKGQYSSGFNKDTLTAGIDAIYERNAILENKLREAEIQITNLKDKVSVLESENKDLQQEISENSMEKDDFDYGQSL